MQGVSIVIFLVCSLATNVRNFHKRHYGKALGLLGGTSLIGPTVLGVIYKEYFGVQSNVAGYWLMLGVTNFVLSILGALLMKDYSHLVEDTTSENTTSEKEPVLPERTSAKANEFHHLEGFALVKNLDYQLLFWSHIISAAVGHIFIFNMIVIIESYRLDSFELPFLISMPLIIAVTKLCLGTISDSFINTIPRTLYVSIGMWLQAITILLLVIFGENKALFVLCFIFAHVSNGLIYSVHSAYVSDFFGKENFGINWGGILVGDSLSDIPFMYLFGYFYDKNIEFGHSDCIGALCFQVTFLVSGLSTIFAAILISIVVYREIRWRNGTLTNKSN